MFDAGRQQQSRMIHLAGRQQQSRKMHLAGRQQQSRKMRLAGRQQSPRMDEEPPPPMVKKYWGNFSVTNEETIKGLTEPIVEFKYRDILLWTPEGSGDSTRAELFGSKLRAFSTPQGGDSLFHALSIAALGSSDFEENLRRELRILLNNYSMKYRLLEAFHQGRLRKDIDRLKDLDIDSSDLVMNLQYRDMKLAGTTSNAYLSAFHIFLMSNVLRRPIIVYGEKDPYTNILSSCIPGVYLPTLHPEGSCTKNPLAVVYTLLSGRKDHFTGLVGTEHGLRRVPLFYRGGQDLPIRFGVSAASPTRLAEHEKLFIYLNVSEHEMEQEYIGLRPVLMAEILETPLSRTMRFAPRLVHGRPGVAKGTDRCARVSGSCIGINMGARRTYEAKAMAGALAEEKRRSARVKRSTPGPLTPLSWLTPGRCFYTTYVTNTL